MKTKPGVLAGLIAIAMFVSGEFAVVPQPAARAADVGFACARSTARLEIASWLVQAGTSGLSRWAKS